VQHDEQQRRQLAALVYEAMSHRAQISAEQRDFDQAKAVFMRWFV
jgi:hypothetical protein